MTNNLRIWDAVSKTDPKHTKPVSFGSRKFTSIDAHWQIMRMTEQFGPVGQGWGYDVEHSIATIADGISVAVADVTIWWRSDEDRVARYGPLRGMSPLLEKNRLDDDAGKKAMTDALTKGLSHLGLSADVFLGLFDDNKYVQRITREFATNGHADQPSVPAEDRGLLKNGDDPRSQYEVDKRKTAESFVAKTLETFGGMAGSTAISDWYKTPISPKGRSSNRDAVERLKESFPDLGIKLETAADEVRLRNGARMQ